MNAPLNRFNWLSRHYDSLAKFVFGKAIYNSQTHFLTVIPQGSKLLMIGGGSGEVLRHLAEINPACSIWYVEASSGMLAMAERNLAGKFRNNVKFIHGTEESIPEGMQFDVIITNFILDIYPDTKVLALCEKLYEKLRQKGFWLVCDFVNRGRWWQQTLLWLMYRFFVITCKIEASALPAWEDQLRLTGMREKAINLFFGGFIKSAVYSK